MRPFIHFFQNIQFWHKCLLGIFKKNIKFDYKVYLPLYILQLRAVISAGVKHLFCHLSLLQFKSSKVSTFCFMVSSFWSIYGFVVDISTYVYRFRCIKSLFGSEGHLQKSGNGILKCICSHFVDDIQMYKHAVF
jgi:hypothetical protein